MLLVILFQVASLALVSAFQYQVTVLRLDGKQPAVCYGALITDNTIITSAQCVAQALPQAVRITLGSSLTAYNISRIIVNEHFNPETLYPDVALLQLQNATLLAATGARPIQVDWQQQQWTNCRVNFPHNATNGLTQAQSFSDVHQACNRTNGRNLTMCTSYHFQDTTLCANTSPELNIDRGTPLLCGGLLTGLLSNLVQAPRPVSVYPCPTNATAYYTRFDRTTFDWMQKQVIVASRPPTVSPKQPVPRWPANGAVPGHPRPCSGASSERCSPVGVVLGMVMFILLSSV